MGRSLAPAPSAATGGRFRRLRKEDGYVVALLGLLLIPLLVFTSFAVDLGAWYARAAQMQRASDASALAAVKYLPNFSKATTEARQVAARNGFVHDPAGTGITVDVTPASASTLKVTIQDPNVDQYFSGVVRDNVTIARAATAEFIRAVPMGSPRNFLGTGNLNPDGPNRENFWLSVSGYCARNEHGDRITPRADNNGNGAGFTCNPGTDPNPANTQPQPNRDFRAGIAGEQIGYFYGIEFKQNATQSWDLEVFDGPHCEGAGSGGPTADSGTRAAASGPHNGRSGERRYRFRVRANDAIDPLQTTILSDIVLSPADCAAWGNQWRNLRTFANATEGVYYLQIIPLVPTIQTGVNAQEGQNQLGLRMRPTGGAMVYCTTDPTITTATLDPGCPNVFGLTHLGVYANITATAATAQPSFYLASVDSQHNGRQMEIELFDPAEGALGIEILDPNGNPITFTWEVACKDSSYRSESGSTTCPTNENQNGPPGGWGPNNANYLDVSGGTTSAQRPWRLCSGTTPNTGCNTQDGRYSDRLIRLQFDLPDDIDAAYSGRTWWRIRYTVPSSGTLGDRTTWSISIKGDPLRLVPNT